jgi:hypothetical protein
MLTAPSIARPVVAALALLAAVALTGIVLWFWWPGGVALGIAVGALSMLAVGARMQRSNDRIPTDAALQQRLGIADIAEVAERPAPAARPVAAPQPVVAQAAVAAPPAAAPLSARADDAFFTTSAAVAPVAAPEPVAQPEPVASTPEPQPAGDPEPVPVPEPEPAPATLVAEAPVPAADPEVAAAPEPDRVDDGPEVIPSTDFVLTDQDDDGTVRADLDRLKEELGDDYLDFARAARLVVSTQYASAARLQRDLEVPYSRARRLLTDLEQQHFVGPATGSLPRVVLMPKDRLPEVERLLAEA